MSLNPTQPPGSLPGGRRKDSMARQRRRRQRRGAAVAAALVLLLGGAGVWSVFRGVGQPLAEAGGAAPAGCTRLRVVAAASYAPVVRAVAGTVRSGKDCASVEVLEADGEAAVDKVKESVADVWLPDDEAWRTFAPADLLAPPDSPAGPGRSTVLATSPVYLVTDPATASRVRAAGGSWRALADLASASAPVRIKVVDPEDAGAALVGLGSVGEGVWLRSGMNASALSLVRAQVTAVTVDSEQDVLPDRAGEVSLISESSLLRRLPGLSKDAVVMTGRDHTAVLRYTWLGTAKMVADPARAAAAERLRRALTSAAAAPALAQAGLRETSPAGTGRPPQSAGADRLPKPTAPPFPVLGAHKVEHVLAAWKRPERRANILVVIDVSSSMSAKAPGSTKSLIEVVADSCRSLAALLPDDSRLGVWVFGSRLQGSKDYQVLVPPARLDPGQRRRLTASLLGLRTRRTGTGLYDTLLAAYRADLPSAGDPAPTHVLVFTDGRNEADPGSITAPELGRQLALSPDDGESRSLSVLAFGSASGSAPLSSALRQVDGFVQPALTAADVTAAFVHLAAGGLHSEYGGS
jgi:hypothetical protein